MGLSCLIGVSGIITPVLVILTVLLMIFLRRKSPLLLWSALLSALLSCTPFFSGLAVYNFVVDYHGLVEMK